MNRFPQSPRFLAGQGRACHHGIALVVCLFLAAAHVEAQNKSAEPSQKSFRVIVVACDLPDGLRLTINQQPVPTLYRTGKVTDLSVFKPGTYSIKADSPGCLPCHQKLTIEPGMIQTWIFFVEPVTEEEINALVVSRDTDDPREHSLPTRALKIRNLTAPTKITKPATALIDLTGAENGITLLLDRQTVHLQPALPKMFPARNPGAFLELAEKGSAAAPFFTQRIQPGNHAIVAIFRLLNGRLTAAMKTL